MKLNKIKIGQSLAALVLVNMLISTTTAGGDPMGALIDEKVAQLSVNPVILTLDNDQAIRTITLRNGGERAMVMQAVVNTWGVADNRDHYVPTEDLVVTPPVFTLQPGEEQILRVGLQNPVPDERERAYRIFLEQSPASSPGPVTEQQQRAAGIRINLRVGIPVFVAPAAERRAEIDWTAVPGAENRLSLQASNRGNAHFRLSRLELADAAGRTLTEAAGPTYLLAGTTRRWQLSLPADATGPYRLRLWNRDGSQETTLSVD